MDEFVNQVAALAIAITVLWFVVVGIAVMVRGPRAGAIVLWWPVRTSFRLLRRGIGGLLIVIGELIRG